MSPDQSLFIFSDAAPQLPEVDEWLSGDPPELYSIARHWFREFRNCGADVNELLHDGCPTACVDGAAFGYVNVFRNHVNVGFYTGAFLDDPHKLLIGAGKRMRHIKLKPGSDIDSQALCELIRSAYLDVKSRLH